MIPQAPVVTPIVLAAGTARRFGGNKALAPFDGETCVSLVLRACREGGAWPPVVVLGHAGEAILATLPADARTCWNPRHAVTGPAASLQAGLDRLADDAEGVLLYPVDFPLVTGAEIAALIDRWATARARGVRIVVPSFDMRRGHPALLDRSLVAELRRLPPDAPIHQVIRAHERELEHVVVDRPWVRMDMDTPEDYARCLAAYRERNR